MTDIYEKLNTLSALSQQHSVDIQGEVVKQEQYRLKHQRYEKMSQFLETIRETLTRQVQAVFEQLQNLALSDIMCDREYTFKTDINHKYGSPNFDAYTIKTFQGEKNLCGIDKGGSGLKGILRISSMLSMLLLLNRNRFLAIDEEMTAVSKDNQNQEDYLENLMLWFKEMLQKFDIQVLLVSHERSIIKHADKKFKVQIDEEGNAQVMEIA